jgi:ABC-type uncharacterized transport system permease subunit
MQKNINTYLTAFIIIMCLVFAWFMAFTDLMQREVPGTKRKIFIGILLLYAVYRSFRWYRQNRKTNSENEEV